MREEKQWTLLDVSTEVALDDKAKEERMLHVGCAKNNNKNNKTRRVSRVAFTTCTIKLLTRGPTFIIPFNASPSSLCDSSWTFTFCLEMIHRWNIRSEEKIKSRLFRLFFFPRFATGDFFWSKRFNHLDQSKECLLFIRISLISSPKVNLKINLRSLVKRLAYLKSDTTLIKFHFIVSQQTFFAVFLTFSSLGRFN